jgi:hypothetical protein
MVVIKKFENTIPVDFGEFELRFVVSDENILKLAELKDYAKELQEKLSNLSGTTSDLKTVKDLAKDLWVKLFDEDTFNRVYDVCGRSCIPTFLAAVQTIKGIADEMENSMTVDKYIKYLDVGHA